jgi:serine/threonine-protein kinase
VGVLCLVRGPAGSSPRQAFAQAQDAQRKAAAEALFDEGTSLLGQGDYAAACSRLEQSQRIDAGVGTLLYLGECSERLGKLASARAIFREAASAARASGQADRAQMGDERARELRPRLAQLTLLVPANAPHGFELLLDGEPVFPALFGVPFPVDEGSHQLLARAPGHQSWTAAVDVQGEAARKSVPVASLIAAPGATVAAASPEPLPSEPTASAATSGRDEAVAGGSQRTLALWVGGAGVATLGVAAVFGLTARSKDDEAVEDFCVRAGCFDPKGAELNQSARNWALAANVGYGLGAAALVTGAVLYFTGSGDEADSLAGGLQIAPVLGSLQGVSVTGQF